MSHILKIALCPAPFQKSKKKGDKRKDKKLGGSATELHFQQILPASLVPSFGGNEHNSTTTRPSSISPRSSMSSGSPQQPLRSAYSHSGVDARAIVVPPPPVLHEEGTGSSYMTRHGGPPSAGYQSDYFHYSSHHVTAGSSYGDHGGSLEVQVLAKATKDRPANLRMTAIRDYSPGCNEELSVRKGQRVRVMYRNHDWVFAVTKHGHSGFIPFSYVRPSRKYNGYQSEPEIAGRVEDAYISGYETDVTQFPFPPSATPRPTTTSTQHHHHGGRSRVHVPAAYSINTGACRRVGSGSPPMQMNVDNVFDSGYMSAIEGPTYHHSSSVSSSRYRPTTVKPSMDSFPREFIEEIVVIHSFEAKEEDEVYVSKGERVRVLNANDPNWLWVVTTRMGEEGFIPRSCCTLGNHPSLSSPDFHSTRTRRQMDHVSSSRRQHPAHHYPSSRHHHHHSSSQHSRNMRLQAKDRFKHLAMNRSIDPTSMDKEDIKKLGTKLIVLMDYEAVMSDELSVEFAETLLADVMSQNGVDRIWVYCPRTDSCGYVPMSMVVPPVV